MHVAKSAVLKIKHSLENIALSALCVGRERQLSREKKRRINKLIEDLDAMVEDARKSLSRGDMSEFEKHLINEMRCYYMLSDVHKGILVAEKRCPHNGCSF